MVGKVRRSPYPVWLDSQGPVIEGLFAGYSRRNHAAVTDLEIIKRIRAA